MRRLAPDDARKELMVRIHFVVTRVNAASGGLFVQDDSAGIFVFIFPAREIQSQLYSLTKQST